jgi:predicted MPP superfamily phosphohydrolase
MISYRKETILERKSLESNKSKDNNIVKSFLEKVVFPIPIWKHIFKRYCENLEVNNVTFKFNNLPKSFNDYKILFVSDLHLEIKPNPLNYLDKIELPEYDIVIIGGDFFDNTQNINENLLDLFLKKFKKPIYAILGNHDSYKIIDVLKSKNVEVLLNESILIEKNNEKIMLTGIDDVCSFNNGWQHAVSYKSSELFSGFKIMLSHSPDFLPVSESLGYSLQLSGHTHGGQFLILNKVLFPHTVFDFAISSDWEYKKMLGYTSTGFGNSGYPIRNIFPEISIITLSSF